MKITPVFLSRFSTMWHRRLWKNPSFAYWSRGKLSTSNDIKKSNVYVVTKFLYTEHLIPTLFVRFLSRPSPCRLFWENMCYFNQCRYFTAFRFCKIPSLLLPFFTAIFSPVIRYLSDFLPLYTRLLSPVPGHVFHLEMCQCFIRLRSGYVTMGVRTRL